MSTSNPYAPKSASQDSVEEPVIETPKEDFDQTVPNGSVSKVLEWVDGSKVRALAALKAERDGKNRTTLIDDLENLV